MVEEPTFPSVKGSASSSTSLWARLHDLVGDLGEAAADEAEHADIFDQAVARRVPGDVGNAETEACHHHGVELEGAVAERSLGADRADQAADEGPLPSCRSRS